MQNSYNFFTENRGPGFPCLLESPGFFSEISRTWKGLENEFGSEKSWNLPVVQLNLHAFYVQNTMCK